MYRTKLFSSSKMYSVKFRLNQGDDHAFTSRAFSVFAPKLINSLPKHITDMFPSDPVTESVSVDYFKRALKTFLFQSGFPDVA